MNNLIKDYNYETEGNKNKSSLFFIVLFWGALWGIVETTIGSALHMMPFRIPTGTILFPVGYYFMNKSYQETQSLKSIFLTSVIASSIKLISLTIPALPVIRVFNPALCILFEGMAVAYIFTIIQGNIKKVKFSHCILMSSTWRIGYYLMCFLIFIPLDLMKISSILAWNKFFEFFIINGLINSILIYSYSKFSTEDKMKLRINYKPIYSIVLFILALFIQWKY